MIIKPKIEPGLVLQSTRNYFVNHGSLNLNREAIKYKFIILSKLDLAFFLENQKNRMVFEQTSFREKYLISALRKREIKIASESDLEYLISVFEKHKDNGFRSVFQDFGFCEIELYNHHPFLMSL